MKLIILPGLFIAAAAFTPFACHPGAWGACCVAYDPGDKLCYEGSFATPVNTTNATSTTDVYECTHTIDIFSECCTGPKPTTNALPYTNCTPGTIQIL